MWSIIYKPQNNSKQTVAPGQEGNILFNDALNTF